MRGAWKTFGLEHPVRQELRALVRIAAPVVGVQLSNLALFTTDVLMAGRLGAGELAAIAVGHSFMNPVVISAMGVLMALNPIVAHLVGGDLLTEIGEKLRQGLWVALLLSAPAIWIAQNSLPVMRWAEIDPVIRPTIDGYLRAISWGLPFHFAYLAMRFFNDGLAKTRPAFFIALAAIPLNAVLDWVLMFGVLGAPRLGATGTGYATAAVWTFSCAAMAFYTYTRGEFRGMDRFRFSWPRWAHIREILAIGVPNGVNISMEVGMFAAAALMMGALGLEAAAAHQISINIAAVMYMFPLGVGIALSARVGQAAGRGAGQATALACWTGLGLCAAIALVGAFLIYAFRPWLIGLYTSEAEVTGLAMQLLIFGAVFQLSDGVQTGSLGALRGLKDTRKPMFACAIAYWCVGAPLGYWLGMRAGWGPSGIWTGLILGLTLAATLHVVRLRRMLGPDAGFGGGD